MKDQAPIPRSEYAVLLPVERHAKLVELYQLLPKSDPHAEYKDASDKETELVKDHTQILRDESKSDDAHREAFANIRKIYDENRDYLDGLEKKSDQERERRANSEDKKLLLGRVTGLLEFSPTTDEFRQVVLDLFSNDYDVGLDGANKSDPLSHAILIKNAESGGFFSQENACDIEILAYREKKSWLDMSIHWNSLIERVIGGGAMTEELANTMLHKGVDERSRFLEKWELAFKDRYGVDPQV